MKGKRRILLGRAALAALFVWTAPAVAFCELDCASAPAEPAHLIGHGHRHEATARAHGAAVPHGLAPASDHHRSDRRDASCCCLTAALLAARVADAQEMAQPRLALAHLAASSAARAPLPALVALPRAKAPPGSSPGGLPVARNLPLLL